MNNKFIIMNGFARFHLICNLFLWYLNLSRNSFEKKKMFNCSF